MHEAIPQSEVRKQPDAALDCRGALAAGRGGGWGDVQIYEGERPFVVEREPEVCLCFRAGAGWQRNNTEARLQKRGCGHVFPQWTLRRAVGEVGWDAVYADTPAIGDEDEIVGLLVRGECEADGKGIPECVFLRG